MLDANVGLMPSTAADLEARIAAPEAERAHEKPGAVRRHDGWMASVYARVAHDDELEAVAALRWRWVGDREQLPIAQRAPFVRDFAVWARGHSATHPCVVVLDQSEVVGMAFLAVTARGAAPPRALTRASGDVQCVYLVPEARGNGLGGLLIQAVLDLAAELGLERVTVHSSERAVSVYQRHGFTASPVLLQTQPARP